MRQRSIMDDAPFHAEVAEGPNIVTAHWIFANDGIRLRVAHWPGLEASKGTVFLLQGRTENIEKYGRTVAALHELGYTAFAIDWRGQGLSDRLTEDRMTGHVAQFSDYQKDVEAMLEAAQTLDLPKPWYVIGHSLGACIGLRAIIEGFPATACAFTAPLWDINLPPLQRLGAWPLSWGAQAFGKGHAYAPGTRGESYVLTTAFEDNRLTHDPDMYRYYINISEALPNQQLGGPSMGWLLQTLKETRALSKLSSPDIPCVTFHGVEDEIVDIPAIRDRMARWSGGKLEPIENGRHDVLCETPDIRKEIITKVDDLFLHAGSRK